MNLQKPEPAAKGDGSTLDVHSIFYTLQGEGPFAGHPAVFVRLAGCNLQCYGCDTEYTQGRQKMSIRDICDAVLDCVASDARLSLVVITGGEPLRQPIGRLIRILRSLVDTVQIESNGVLTPDADTLDAINMDRNVKLIVSPKTSAISSACAMLADAFKYVLDANFIAQDGLPSKALEHPSPRGVARPPHGTPIYVNPYDTGDAEQNARNLRAVARSCMRYGYIAGVQMHKILDLA